MSFHEIFIYVILLLAACSFIFDFFEKKKMRNILKRILEKRKESIPDSETDENSADSAQESPDSINGNEEREERENLIRTSLQNILTDMGCQPLIVENGSISVAYQGEKFFMQMNGTFVRIWDLNWMSCKPTDDDFPIMKDAMNYANFTFGPTIIMHAPETDGEIFISSRMDIHIDPQYPENEIYLKSILDSFFNVKHMMQREFIRLRDDPSDRTMNFNPIGFDTATLSDPTSPQAN